MIRVGFRFFPLFVLVSSLFISFPAFSQKESKPVYADGVSFEIIRILDGDTVVALIDGKNEEQVRFLSIDTPESSQPYGKESTEALQKMLPPGKKGRLKFSKDQRGYYGRLLAYLYVGNRNINLEMIKKGWAAIYIYSPFDNYAQKFLNASVKAAEAGNGIWSHTDPLQEMPYEYRRNQRSRHSRSWAADPRNHTFVRPRRSTSIPAWTRVFFLTDGEAEKTGFSFIEL